MLARVKITPCEKRRVLRGVIFTRPCISLALPIPEEKWETTLSLALTITICNKITGTVINSPFDNKKLSCT